MLVKPSRAFVGKPSVVASSSGSAKKARYARLLPSTRKSSASRAGASLRSSSAPVSVFGDTRRAYFRVLAHGTDRPERADDGFAVGCRSVRADPVPDAVVHGVEPQGAVVKADSAIHELRSERSCLPESERQMQALITRHWAGSEPHVDVKRSS